MRSVCIEHLIVLGIAVGSVLSSVGTSIFHFVACVAARDLLCCGFRHFVWPEGPQQLVLVSGGVLQCETFASQALSVRSMNAFEQFQLVRVLLDTVSDVLLLRMWSCVFSLLIHLRQKDQKDD